jgi:hypothetical protein
LLAHYRFFVKILLTKTQNHFSVVAVVVVVVDDDVVVGVNEAGVDNSLLGKKILKSPCFKKASLG